ncbi:MAG: 50S ribosomal protein L11 methyltransferase [Myxococcaceae bacterium]|nr:50S ribosomal protein L11 methyltransferase [Myxococcaceae bacterium]MCA3014613.1 50S ribosomal protein L11 methyltransferase [Myxococcaceae bacterium]
MPSSPLWHATPEEAAALGLAQPYWAVAWPGGQALARWVLDHPEAVAGRRVLDVGSGGAIEGLAAAKAGAAVVVCADVDPVAAVVASMNAALNGLDGRGTSVRGPGGAVGDLAADAPAAAAPVGGGGPGRLRARRSGPQGGAGEGARLGGARGAPRALLEAVVDDPLARPPADLACDVVLVGDLSFDAAITARLVPWLRSHAALGRLVLVGDAGRVELPDDFVAVGAHHAPYDGNPLGSTDWLVTVRRLPPGVRA